MQIGKAVTSFAIPSTFVELAQLSYRCQLAVRQNSNSVRETSKIDEGMGGWKLYVFWHDPWLVGEANVCYIRGAVFLC